MTHFSFNTYKCQGLTIVTHLGLAPQIGEFRFYPPVFFSPLFGLGASLTSKKKKTKKVRENRLTNVNESIFEKLSFNEMFKLLLWKVVWNILRYTEILEHLSNPYISEFSSIMWWLMYNTIQLITIGNPSRYPQEGEVLFTSIIRWGLSILVLCVPFCFL